MGWYFLSEYQDFYRPGDPYGIVKWYVYYTDILYAA